MPQTCENCLFYDQTADGKKRGTCHRYPPVISDTLLALSVKEHGEEDELPTDIAYDELPAASVWPATYDNEWCGEFKSESRGTGSVPPGRS